MTEAIIPQLNNMSPNAVYPKPKYEIFGFDSGVSKSDSDMVKKVKANRQVRLPYFEQKQNMHSIDLILDIEGVGNQSKDKLTANFTPRSLHFTVEDLDGEDIHLIIPRLAHEINPSQSYVTIKNKNAVVITLMKIKPQMWKTVFYNTELVKKLWAQTMREFVQTVIDPEDVASVLKEIWNQAQIIYTDDINFFLNAPTPFGPIHCLKGAKSIDDVIEKLKNNITNRNDIFVKAFFLGAAVLFKLKKDHDDEFKDTEPNESENANLEEESACVEARLKKIALMDVAERKAFANRKKEIGNKHLRAKRYTLAIRYYSEAIDLYPDNPIFYSNRSACYFILKNYQESFEDACKAIDLDPLFDKGFYRAHKALAALELPNLATYVAHLALEFDQDNRGYFNRLMSDDLLSLKNYESLNSSSSELYVKCDRRLKQMENFEKIRYINREFEVEKNYEKVQAMAKELLEHGKTPTVTCGYYYLSYCSYFLNDEESAVKYIEKLLKLNYDHSPAKRLDEIICNFYSSKENAFINFIEGKYPASILWYKKGILSVHGYPNHTAQFYFLIGLTRKAQNKAKDAIKYFSQSIDLRNDYPFSYFMRGECFESLGMLQEAQDNFDRAFELYQLTEISSEANKNVVKSQISENFQKMAEEHFENGNLYSAAEYYKLAVLSRPNDAKLYWKCAVTHRKLQRIDEALRLASKAVELDPKLGHGYLEKARPLIILGYVDRAIDCLDKAERLLSIDEVKTDMGRALTLKAFLKRGNNAIEKNEHEAAEMYLAEAKKIAFLDFDLQIKLVQCRSQLKKENKHKIVENSSQTVANNLTETVADNLTETVLDNLTNGSVVEENNKNLESNSSDIPIADTYCILGACAYHQGKKDDALNHFQKALEYDPNHEKARAAIVAIQQVFFIFEQACDFLSQDRLKDALAFFKMGSMIDEENTFIKAKMHHGLGLTYLNMKDYENAISEFTFAIHNDGDFADAYIKRGECYQRIENSTKAIEDFKLAIELDPAPEYKEILKKAQKKL